MLAAIAVDGHDDVDMLEEASHRRALRWIELVRRNVPLKIVRLQQAVVAGPGPTRCGRCDHVGHLLEESAVERHEADVRSELALLAHARVGQEVGERHECVPVERRRPRATNAIAPSTTSASTIPRRHTLWRSRYPCRSLCHPSTRPVSPSSPCRSVMAPNQYHVR